MVRPGATAQFVVVGRPFCAPRTSLPSLESHLGLEGFAPVLVGAVQGSKVSVECRVRRIELPPITVQTRRGGLYVVWLSDTHYYGGRAVYFRARWRRHLTQFEQGKHPNRYAQAVFDKHGKFVPEVLQTLPTNEQVTAEKGWLDSHFGKTGCVNLSQSPVNNTHVSEAARRKISKAHKGRKHTPEAIRRSSESRRGMKASEEARHNNSRAQTGKKMSLEARQNMSRSSARKGSPITDSMREATIASNKARRGETRSESVRQHLSEVVSKLVWVCNESSSRRVLPSKVPALLGQGWIKGRKYRNR